MNGDVIIDLKKCIKKMENSIFTIWKLILMFVLFAIFFSLFSIDNPQIVVQSRTAGITMTTFAVLSIVMPIVYGGISVGKRLNKEIIPSLSIAIFIVDVITYFQLSIMNVNIYNESTLIFKNVGVFFLVYFLQIIAISLYSVLGNRMYYKLNPPENCIIICDAVENTNEIVSKITRYSNQYKIVKILKYDNKKLFKFIDKNESIFLYNVPPIQKNDIIEYAYKHYKNLYLSTELSDVVINYAKYRLVDDMSMLSSNNKGLSFEQKILKRTLDLVLSLIALIVFAPLMIVVAIVIKVYDRGPILFKQRRATLNGKQFNVLKFRTMIVDADKNYKFQPATKNDDRITPLGKILRKFRIDELPQLFNIIIGDMSIVGPRPERIEHVEMYTQDLPEFEYRLRAKAGLTGLAQIAGKYNTNPKDKLILDLMYIEKYSIGMDIILIFQTLQVFFKLDSTEGFNKDEWKKYR